MRCLIRFSESDVTKSASINLSYRSKRVLENHVYSVQNLISFYTFSVAVRRSPKTASSVVISSGYRGDVSRVKNFGTFQWETYKSLCFFRCSSWKR